MKLDNDTAILEYVSRETLDIKKLSDTLQKIHNKDYDCASKANEMVN